MKNNNLIKKSFLIVLSIVLILINSFFVFSVECPFGIINDSDPGQCGRYIDINSNNYCDLSEPCNSTYETPIGEISGEELKSMTIKEVSQLYKIDSIELTKRINDELGTEFSENQKLLLLHDNYGFKMSSLKEIISEIQKGVTEKEIDSLAENNNTYKNTKVKSKYNFFIITLITLVTYFLTWLLYKFNKISLITHRKIWNWVLLISFFLTTIFAIIWLVNIDLGLRILIPLNTSFWHIETGIVMIIVSIFHALWHIKYYKFLKKSK